VGLYLVSVCLAAQTKTRNTPTLRCCDRIPPSREDLEILMPARSLACRPPVAVAADHFLEMADWSRSADALRDRADFCDQVLHFTQAY